MKNKVILRLIIPPALIIAFAIYVFISLSTKNSSPPSQSGWVLQTNLQSQLRGRTISDMTFTDSVTGYAVTPWVYNDSAFIFKTTNGGDNWYAILSNSSSQGGFNRIKFINKNTGFTCGDYFKKTTNSGISWVINEVWNNFGISAEKMHILNEDTIFLTNSNGLNGGVFRTTNGGQNWEHLYWAGNDNPTDIYMYNVRIGFQHGIGFFLYKTTNGGFNWFAIDSGGFNQMYFLDSLTGYRTYNSMKKTTNGGYNWVSQYFPGIPGVSTIRGISKFQFIGTDTIIGIGGSVWYPNPGRNRGLIYKTTNGGINWGYQLPDTHNIQISSYQLINFIVNKYGWIYNAGGMGIHTTSGGDSTIYVGINNNITPVAKNFILHQNYPNPFNSISNIKYNIEISGNIKIVVFDIRGKEIITLVNKQQNAGEYKIKFDGYLLTSGIYFYSLYVDDSRIDTKKLILIK